jgi:response regulator of citrate/malate metabolism
LKLLSSVRPDVVFLDNNLPDGQGVSLIKSIKEEMPSTTVILITAMDNAKEDALKYGADIFLGKPLTFASIKEALGRVSQKIS